jgi:hypothetical protein
MKIELDLTGSEDVRDDLGLLLDGYAALEDITCADAQRFDKQLDRVSVLLSILNHIQKALHGSAKVA